jgi:DNA-binding beta-propeller fold protein YncE
MLRVAALLPIALVLLGGIAIRAGIQRVGLDRESQRYLVSTGQWVKPSGKIVTVDNARPKDLAVRGDGWTAVLCTGQVLLMDPSGGVASSVPLNTSSMGIVWSKDGNSIYASTLDSGVARIPAADGKLGTPVVTKVESPRPRPESPFTVDPAANPHVCGLAVSADGNRLFAALSVRNVVKEYQLPEMSEVGIYETDVAPFRLRISPDGKRLAIACRGGAQGKWPDSTAGTPVRTARRTDAVLSGSVQLVDLAERSMSEVVVGPQPSGVAFSADSSRLYVVDSDADRIEEFDLRRMRRVRTRSIASDEGFGAMPTDVITLGDRLLVSCGGLNALMVYRQSDLRPIGAIPTAWFPISLASYRDGVRVACAKGFGTQRLQREGRYAVADTIGVVQLLSGAELARSAELARDVETASRWMREETARPNRTPVAVPERVGEPSLFKHVVYIIKENLTYDSVFGDVPEGDGEPSLVLFPESVTPNHHALAKEFVLLDNTYTSGTVSADGHHWCVSAIANAYHEQNHASWGRGYPFNGGDPLANSPAGFLWNALAGVPGKTVRVYGEFADKLSITNTATGKTSRWEWKWKELWDAYRSNRKAWKPSAATSTRSLKPFLHPEYMGYLLSFSDQWRADQYLDEFREFERRGNMPSLSIVHLPNDHAAGRSPDYPTPQAMVADNDLAMGRIVEAITKSRFWKDTVILVIEDDSQLGLDHVDGHRTVALCLSPYSRLRTTISEFYNHASFVRTMGLVLGFPALTRFDRGATPLTRCFTGAANLDPYECRVPKIALDTMNPAADKAQGDGRRLALESQNQNWREYDRADPRVVAEAIWHSVHPDRPFPQHYFKYVEDDE